jgi:hypothetical protein
MQKHFILLASMTVLAGTTQMGCSKEAPSAETATPPKVIATTAAASTIPLSHSALLQAMAADPLVVDDYRATTKYVVQMKAWFDSTPVAQRKARMKAYSEATARGENPVNPAHTAAEEQAELARSKRANELINAKYPQLAAMSPEERGDLDGELSMRFDEQLD